MILELDLDDVDDGDVFTDVMGEIAAANQDGYNFWTINCATQSLDVLEQNGCAATRQLRTTRIVRNLPTPTIKSLEGHVQGNIVVKPAVAGGGTSSPPPVSGGGGKKKK